MPSQLRILMQTGDTKRDEATAEALQGLQEDGFTVTKFTQHQGDSYTHIRFPDKHTGEPSNRTFVVGVSIENQTAAITIFDWMADGEELGKMPLALLPDFLQESRNLENSPANQGNLDEFLQRHGSADFRILEMTKDKALNQAIALRTKALREAGFRIEERDTDPFSDHTLIIANQAKSTEAKHTLNLRIRGEEVEAHWEEKRHATIQELPEILDTFLETRKS